MSKRIRSPQAKPRAVRKVSARVTKALVPVLQAPQKPVHATRAAIRRAVRVVAAERARADA
jgi:hypothetical protein